VPPIIPQGKKILIVIFTRAIARTIRFRTIVPIAAAASALKNMPSNEQVKNEN